MFSTWNAFQIRNKAKGFTLSEVLITLGIIGVVASMTLPTLIAKYNKKQTAIAVKKVYSELSQVIRRAEVDYGELQYWPTNNALCDTEAYRSFVRTYILPYYKGFKLLKNGLENELWNNNGVSPCGINGITNNGTIISTSVHSGIIFILVDINGYKKPNYMGQDIFYFNTATGKLMPSGWEKNLTREQTLSGYISEDGLRFSCKKSKTNPDDDYTDKRHACTALLMLDGWEFKDDYPW